MLHGEVSAFSSVSDQVGGSPSVLFTPELTLSGNWSKTSTCSSCKELSVDFSFSSLEEKCSQGIERTEGDHVCVHIWSAPSVNMKSRMHCSSPSSTHSHSIRLQILKMSSMSLLGIRILLYSAGCTWRRGELWCEWSGIQTGQRDNSLFTHKAQSWVLLFFTKGFTKQDMLS